MSRPHSLSLGRILAAAPAFPFQPADEIKLEGRVRVLFRGEGPALVSSSWSSEGLRPASFADHHLGTEAPRAIALLDGVAAASAPT